MSVPLTAIPRPQWREKLTYLTWQIRRSPLTMAGLLITLMVVMCMIFAPWLASHDPNALNLAERLAPTPRLIPEDVEQRARMFGITREIIGRRGLGWTSG